MRKFVDADMEHFCLIKSKTLIKCMMCEELTPYVDYISEGRICSTTCFDTFYTDYQKWINKMDRIEREQKGETNEED